MNENQIAASTRETENAPRALLLDDNLMSALRVRRQLQLLNYAVDERRDLSTDEANAAPELVVINLGSRGMDGVALAKSCREISPNACVVGFCGHLETEIRRAARDAGIHKILTNDEAFSDLSKALAR